MPIDDATWKQVRAAYADTKNTVVEICQQFGIRHQDLYARRSAESWPLRDKRKSDSLRRAPASKGGNDATAPHATTSRAARASLILRLYNAIDLKLTQMEQLMSDPDATSNTSSADHEREARTIAGLVRNFERVTEMDADLTKPAAKSARPGNANATPTHAAPTSGPAALTTAAALTADPARAMLLRRDIAQRLERIMGKGNPPGDAG